MRSRFVLVVAPVLALLVPTNSPRAAQEFNGFLLLNFCGPKTQVESDCALFVLGVMDTLRDLRSNGRAHCVADFPADLSADEGGIIVRDYLLKHPAAQKWSATRATQRALAEQFPCPLS